MRFLITLITILTFANLSWTQISFYKLFSDNGSDFGQGIVQLEDSSYVITGASSSYWGGATQAFLLKIDSSGNRIWSNSYGGVETDWGRRVLYKKNVGFYICGYTNSYGNGDYDYYLVKTDEAGNFLWQKTFGGYGWDKVHDAAMLSDTSIVMVGETSSNPTDNLDMYLIRTDKYGDTIWTKTVGGTGDDYATSIRVYQDSLLIIGGSVWVPDSAYSKAYIALYHQDGTLMWVDTTGPNGNYWINDVEYNGNSFTAVGGSTGPDKVGIDSWFWRVTDGGIHETDWALVGGGDREFLHITTFGSANNFFVPEYDLSATSYAGGNDIIVGRNFPLMNSDTTYSIAHINSEMVGDIIRTSDGGGILVGYTTGIAAGGNEIMVVKIGPDRQDFPYIDPNVVAENFVKVEPLNLDNKLFVYPNPANKSIVVTTNTSLLNTAELCDLTGAVIRSVDLSEESSVDVSDLDNGCYIFRFYGDGNVTAVKKVIIQH